MSKPALDYYQLLGVGPDAGPAELKRAFRRRVKQIHPDVNPGNPEASRKMRELVEAYETLLDPVLSGEYRSAVRRRSTVEEFDYRDFLRRAGDPASRAKLIFYDLLHGHEPDALALYRSAQAGGFDLRDWLDREDYMDCAYILAEELEAVGEAEAAFELYYRISRLETQKPYFRFFFDEVIMHLRQLLGSAGALPPEHRLAATERVIQLGLPPRETAWFMKTAAEMYAERNQRARALFYLEESLRLDSRLTGVKELRKKLRFA